MAGANRQMFSSPLFERCFSIILATVAFIFCNGCRTGPSEAEQRAAEARAESARKFKSTTTVKSTTTGKPQYFSIFELSQLTYGYADRYYMVIGSAVDAIKRGNPDPTQRRLAHQIKLNGVQAINDIVSNNDPYAQILDLVVAVTLQSRLAIDENRAEQLFGDRAPGLIKAMRTMRVEAWDLAAKVLTQDQLELLDYIILEWRRTHPDIEEVVFVKFDNFASARAAQLLQQLKAGEGFLAPLSEASQVLKDWDRLAERAFWYSKRAPNIAAIQAEGAVNEILAEPEIGSMFQVAERLSKTAESIPHAIETERQALFAQLDTHQNLLTNSLDDIRHIVSDVNSLGNTCTLLNTNLQMTLAALNETLKTTDEVGRHMGFDKPSARPFDIQDYIAALIRFNEAVTNANQLSLSADQLTRSEGWKKALQDMTDATDRRVDRAFSRLCLLLGLAFFLAIAYRLISFKLDRRIARTVQPKP
jgi:hypothetical protein